MKALLKQMLAPVHEALAGLHESAEDNRRQGNNLICKGVVKSAPGGTKVVVEIGENTTPPIQFLVPAAGVTSHYRCPSPGEIAIVLNFGTGDDFSSCVALCGLFSGSFPFPTENPDEVLTVFGDKAYTKIDVPSGKMTIHAAGGVEFVNTPEVKNTDGEMADKVRAMSGDRAIYDGHNHTGDDGGNTSTPKQKQGG
ncbi:phage baseplate assembly protein V [Dryocola clanedunensis]|uniref:phage baseplate assembly protein V n=1 Tax=Cedecea sulfonylureivorans TaxID=3051154 RepID=UPI001925FB2E|nr:phage baseplate assembly protein V [Cedecea sulfonylureivorans]